MLRQESGTTQGARIMFAFLVQQEVNTAAVAELRASKLTSRPPGRSLSSRPVSWEQGEELELVQARMQCNPSCLLGCWRMRMGQLLGVLKQACLGQTMPCYRRLISRLRSRLKDDSREANGHRGFVPTKKEIAYTPRPLLSSLFRDSFPFPPADGGIHCCRQWWHHIYIWRAVGLHAAQLLKRSRR